MDYNVTIQCFHGTNSIAAENILRTKAYTLKYRDNHWLGQGVYFFREDPSQAMAWALSNTEVGDNAIVLSTVIDVNSSFFLDLDSRTGLIFFKEFIEYIKSEKLFPKVKEQEGEHKLRCFILDLLPSTVKAVQKNFKLDKKPKIFKDELLEKMGLEQRSLQICVRDQSIIKKESINAIMEEKKKGYSIKIEKRGPKINFQSRSPFK